jgi:hypothetical protein
MPTYLLDLHDQLFMHLISVYVVSNLVANHLKTYCLNKKTLIASINLSMVLKILQSSYQFGAACRRAHPLLVLLKFQQSAKGRKPRSIMARI